MTVAWIMFWLMGLAVFAGAVPDPLPPEGFSGAQYIDASGCVFLREGADWVMRTDRQGVPLCGFPPTLSQRGLALEGAGPPVPTIEEVLFGQLATGLRDGEFTADPRPMAERLHVAGATGQSPLERDLQARIAGQEAMQAAMSDRRGTDGLCRLLGYETPADTAPVPGRDVTYGLCPGLSLRVPGPVFTEGAALNPVTTDVVDRQKAATPIEPVETLAVLPLADAPVPQPLTMKRPEEKTTAVPREARRRANPSARPQVEMIPAHARFVQIGAYADEDKALSVARKLIGMGYEAGLVPHDEHAPAARLLMAGPFADRSALVRALHDLRARGYDRAFAR